MGAGAGGFPSTAWSLLNGVHERDDERRGAARDRLCRQYWRPVYRFTRHWGYSVEEAKDLTQEFLCHVLESDLIARYQGDSRFRTFLKGALRLYLTQARRDAGAAKRGGGRRVLSLSFELDGEQWLGEERCEGPDEAFDKQWLSDAFAASLGELDALMQAEGKQTQLEVYRLYELQPEGPKTYAEVGAALGINTHQVKNYLTHVRGRLYQLLLARLSGGVGSSAELQAELRDLMAG